MVKVYLAGPDVFEPNALEVLGRKKAILAAAKHEGLSPFDNEVVINGVPNAYHALLIFHANVRMIHEADVVLANLTPFRGPSADVGTVWELAYAHGIGKRVLAYSEVPGDYMRRVTPDGKTIEPFGLRDNLMLEGCLEAAGTRLFYTFEQCVEEL